MIFFKLCYFLNRINADPTSGSPPASRQYPTKQRFFLVLLLVFGVKVSASPNPQRIDLNLTSVPLITAFDEIKKQTGYGFWYEKADLEGTKKVTVKIKSASLRETLDKCFLDQPLTYEIFDKTIVVKKKANSKTEDKSATKKDIRVQGKVSNDKGEPLSGVNVSVPVTGKQTTTDKDGLFSINVPDTKAVIRFSYIGYKAVEQSYSNQPLMQIVFIEELNTLQGVEINAGYYKVNERERTGSISKVSASIIEKQAISNPLQALQGRIPGAEITQTSGVPGGGFRVQIRGRSSINSLQVGNDPLYIVNGVAYPSTTLASGTAASLTNSSSPLNALNPYDIESIEVLKDADATAIYGSRGANGVVLITTKKGTSGNTSINSSLLHGVSRVARFLEVLNTEQYLAMRNEAFKNDGLSPAANQIDINGTWGSERNVNWQKELIGGSAKTTNFSMGISGGNNHNTHLLGVNYYREGTVFPGDFGLTRISVNSSLNLGSETDRFQAKFSANYSYSDNKLVRTDPTGLILLPPNTPEPFDNNGKLTWQNNANYLNPMSYLKQPNNAITNNLVGNIALSYRIFNNLYLKTSLGYTTIKREEFASTPLSSFSPALNLNSTSRASYFTNNHNNTWLVEPQLNYSLRVGNGRLEALAGLTFQENVLQLQTIKASGYNSDEIMENIASASLVEKSQFSNIVYRYNSAYARINYNLKGKYILNLTARRDGSSKFGSGKQFADFGAIGGAWIFSEENFLRDNLPFLSFGKLRASHGITGNDQIPDYGYLELWSNNFAGTYEGKATLYPTRIANDDYAWEVNRKSEMALQLNLFKNKLNLEIAFYRNISSNQLVGLPLPLNTGFASIIANLPAKVQNTGWEFLVSQRIIGKDKLQWALSLNLTVPKNKLLAYPNLNTSVYADSYLIGQPLAIVKTYNVSVDEQTGLYKREDYDNNGVLNNADRYLSKFIGQYFYGGIQNSIIYGQFGLDFLISFNKQNGRNYLSFAGSPGFWNTASAAPNQLSEVLDRWREIGDITTTQKFSTTTNSRSQYLNAVGDGGLSVQDASYLRLKNVAISYTLPSKVLNSLKLKNAQLVFQAQNLLTITNYQGLDPESQGLVLPPLRTVMIGLNIHL